MDTRFAPTAPVPNKHAYIKHPRKDGLIPVTFVFPLSGTRIKKLVKPSELSAKIEGYEVTYV